MRLTEVMTLFNNRMYQMPNNKSDYCSAVVKLGQIEDIEEEHDIDLITLFKALKNGFYSKDGEYHHFSNLYLDNEEIYDGYDKVSYRFKDYGKTWALTKEELL